MMPATARIDALHVALAALADVQLLELYDGATRATRVAKLAPGTTVKVEVIGKLKRPKANSRRIGDAL